MKNISRNLIFSSTIFLFLTACSGTKDQKPETEITRTESAGSVNTGLGFISGMVTEIQPGKDGYTAQLKTDIGTVYYVTISRANLADPQTYRSAAVGDTLTVKGDIWQMENQNHITVREIK